LDLSRVGDVRGRIVGPRGIDLSATRLEIEEVESPHVTKWEWKRRSVVSRDGTFRVRVPGDRVLTLRATHPATGDADEGGTARVEKPQDGVVLSLGGGPTAHLRFDPAWDGKGATHGRVLLFTGEPDGSPRFTSRLVVEGGAARFGGFAPGRWTAWIDVPGFAPVVLREITLGEEPTDLGTVRLQRGSTLRFRLQVPEGQVAPPVYVAVWGKTEPLYARYVTSSGESEVVVPGFGPGAFDLRVSRTNGGATLLQDMVTLDGSRDREWTLDLR
jgi:hypothetical protein